MHALFRARRRSVHVPPMFAAITEDSCQPRPVTRPCSQARAHRRRLFPDRSVQLASLCGSSRDSRPTNSRSEGPTIRECLQRVAYVLDPIGRRLGVALMRRGGAMHAKKLHAVTCAACEGPLPIDPDDPRLVDARAQVTLDGGRRAIEFLLFGACRACGGSLVRVRVDAEHGAAEHAG